MKTSSISSNPIHHQIPNSTLSLTLKLASVALPMSETKKPPSGGGCGVLALYGRIIRRHKFLRRRSSSTSSLPQCKHDTTERFQSSTQNWRRSGSHETALVVSPLYSVVPVQRAPLNYKFTAAANQIQVSRKSTASPRAAPTPTNGLSGELNNMLYDHQQSQGSSTLVRASSGNVMVFGNLGNLRGNQMNGNVLNCFTKTASMEPRVNSNRNNPFGILGANGVMRNIVTTAAKERAIEGNQVDPEALNCLATPPPMETGTDANGKNGYGKSGTNEVTRNVVKKPAKERSNGVMGHKPSKERGNEVAAGTVKHIVKELEAIASMQDPRPIVPKTLEPEEYKEMGNEAYKKGRYDEALELYDLALAGNPGKALYWNNKAAALIGLGLLLEAIDNCSEAVRIDPSYCKAHLRLATLYFRLGEADKSVNHYVLSQKEARPVDITRAQTLKAILMKCNEARKLGDWRTVLKESKSAVSAGADSAPQVLAWQMEALLKLDRHDEADMVLNGAPKFDIDASTIFFGAAKNAYVLMMQAEVDMAAGRFEDAVEVAQMAAQIDPRNREISNVVRRTRVVTSARSKGTELFNASRFGEACTAFQEGLDHVPRNAVFLCNRAACRSKLGQWERAIEDCTAALRVRPSYVKARLRRADCNAKMGRLEAAIRDYEILLKQIPGDEEVNRALSEAQEKLEIQQGGHDAGLQLTVSA